MIGSMGVGKNLLEVREHCLYDPRIRRSRGLIIHVNPVFYAHRVPFFILRLDVASSSTLTLKSSRRIVYHRSHLPRKEMYNSPLLAPDYTPQFFGHETFPLRYGWLKKAYDAVASAQERGLGYSVFNDDAAIARFGVGKNMVAAIRHWATQCGVISPGTKGSAASTAPLGDKIFSSDGLDPYMEHPATLWLLHWGLASNAALTTWYWIFSHYPRTSFEREDIVKALLNLGAERGWSRIAQTTIKRDVECLVRTYAPKQDHQEQAREDAIESPLTELGL